MGLTYCFELFLKTLKQVSESRNKLTLRLLVNFWKTGEMRGETTRAAERCFESMNGSEKMSSEAPLWMLQHRIESDRLRLVAFLLSVHGFDPELLYI